MNKKEILNISKSLKFEANEKTQNKLQELMNKIDEQIKHLQSINTNKVKPMSRIDDDPINYLREDSPQKPMLKEDLLQNAPNSDKDFVFIKNERSEND